MSSVEGLAALIRRMEAIGEAQPVLRAAQIAAVAEAQKIVPVKTHHLQRSIRPGRIMGQTAEVVAATPYAAPVEFGTRPHIIRPKNRKVLAWGGERRLTGRLKAGSQATHFATLVHHPGTRAQPYLLPGARKAVAAINEVIVKLWNRH